MNDAVTAPRRPPPPPVAWAVMTLPFGLTVGFATIAAPFVLRGRGLDITEIATVTQLAQLPHVIKLLWSPALDAGPRRRSWYLGSIVVAAACLAALAVLPVAAGASPLPTEAADPVGLHGPARFPLLGLYTALLFVAQAAVATSGSAILALMAVSVPDARRGAAAGWQTAGNLVGTAAGGAWIAWMLSHLSGATTGLVLAGACAVSTVPALFIDETPPARRNLVRLIRELALAIGRTLRSREGWTGLLICLSPVGTGALTNLFSALATDYASDAAQAEQLVVIVTGVLGGLANAAGAMLGGYIADRFDRRLAYVAFGGATALAALAMMVAPATAAAFEIGSLAYQFTNGLSYAAFYAFVLELLGHREGITTQLALYVGASNFAISYVTWVDGWSYDHLRLALRFVPAATAWTGRQAMLGTDAACTFAGIVLLLAVLRRRRPPRDVSRVTSSA